MFSFIKNNAGIQRMAQTLLGITPKSQREQVDLYRAVLLLKCYSWYKDSSSTTGPGPNLVDTWHDEAGKLVSNNENDSLKAYINNQLTAQIIKMFETIDAIATNTAAASDHFDISLKAERLKSKNDSSSSSIGSSSNSNRTSSSSAKMSLFNCIGFELEARPSNIKDGGEGVFIKNGSVYPGTVLGFFPGRVHLQEYTRKKGYIEALLPDDSFMLMSRYDGHVIDSRNLERIEINSLTLAHKVNHVPVGHTPNVLQVPYNFQSDPLEIDAEFPLRLRKYIPNLYAQLPTLLGTPDRSACMHSMLLIAAKPLKQDDELYMDYRLGDNSPPWFTKYSESNHVAASGSST